MSPRFTSVLISLFASSALLLTSTAGAAPKKGKDDAAAKEKVSKSDMGKSKKNDLLLNIPFMERLNKEKKAKDGNA